MSPKMAFSRLPAVIAMGLLPLTQPANAVDLSVSGFIREEIAIQLNDTQNPFNRGTAVVSGLVPNTTAPGTFFNKTDYDKDSDLNLMATRLEVELNAKISNNWSGFVKLRGYYMADVTNDYGDPNNFEVNNHGSKAQLFEVSDDDYMVDMPSAYFDYSSGPLWIRVGQQQIAWGESLFFRVADVTSGLDLRRHSFLDFGAEEYADERVAAPGIRVSYNLTEAWELEVFAQMFQPSIDPNANTPYNFINSPFTVRNDLGFDKVDDQINGGVRLRGQLDALGVQFFAVSRHNPDPIFHFIPGGQPVPGIPGFETQPFRSTSFPGSRLPSNAGTYGALDWFAVSGLSGLDGVDALNGLAADYPFTGGFLQSLGLTGPDYVTGIDDASPVLDTFFSLLGDLEADIEPIYAAENVFGFGTNYIFYAEPDTLLDQLVVRFEASYTPDKKFSNNLRNDFYEHDEYLTSLVLEKYQRFSEDFPATFLVFEWMHRSETDMVRRTLRTSGGDAYRRPTGGERSGGWDGFVFAVQQPFPSLVWRFDVSVLFDEQGYLFQPAVRYKPNRQWTVEAFANLMDAKDNASLMAPLAWGDELTFRVGYQF